MDASAQSFVRATEFGTFWPKVVAWNLRALGLATLIPADRMVSCLYRRGRLEAYCDVHDANRRCGHVCFASDVRAR